MSDHDSIVITCCNTGAELLTIAGFKILFRCHQHIGIGIESQEVCAPLLCEMVRYHIEVFLRQAQPAAFHAGSDHLEGLACTNAMRQQRIVAVENVRYRIFLMRHQGDFRGHALEADMTAIILAGTNRIKNPVIGRTQILAAIQILENPLLERFPNRFLRLLCKHGFLFVQHTMVAIRIVNRIVDFGITEIQRIFQQLIAVDAQGSVSVGDKRIAAIQRLTRNVPCA